MSKPENAAADLSLLTELVRQVIAEQGIARDDLAVAVAILQRLDGTISGLVNEVRAMHAQHARLERRVRVLEEKA